MELTEQRSCVFTVKCTANSPSCPHPRHAQYKCRSNFADQQARRLRLLEEQKEKRNELFNASRGLIEELHTLHGDLDMEWRPIKTKPKQQKIYRERLMLSEWLVDVPEDLAELWYLVPCPKGHRTLVVATAGNTHAYSKSGRHMAAFQSNLPGGSHNDFKGCTIIDCIWNVTNHSYHVLDVLAWNNQPMLDCEAEFRFYWLKSKMEEMSCLSEHSNDNAFIFLSLPYHQSNESTMTAVMATENLFGKDGPALDGLLFYHSQAHYIPGKTPLVGWLKPYMMSTVLGIPVAPVHLHNVESKKNKKHRKFHNHRGKSQEDKDHFDAFTTEMEVQVPDETEDGDSDTLGEMEPSNTE